MVKLFTPRCTNLNKEYGLYAVLVLSFYSIDDAFEKLQSLMAGSFYVTMQKNPSDVVKARDMILGDHSLCVSESKTLKL